MNPLEYEHMIFQNVDIIASFHSHIFIKEVQTCAIYISTKSTPQNYTRKMLYSFNCKFWVKTRCSTWATHHLWDSPYQPESALVTEHHFSPFCSRLISIFLAKTEPFFFIAVVSMGFLAVRRQGRQRSF